MICIARPDEETEETKYAIKIPKLASLILTHQLDGEVQGLKAWPEEDRPPSAAVFWSFLIMVLLGLPKIQSMLNVLMKIKYLTITVDYI